MKHSIKQAVIRIGLLTGIGLFLIWLVVSIVLTVQTRATLGRSNLGNAVRYDWAMLNPWQMGVTYHGLVVQPANASQPIVQLRCVTLGRLWLHDGKPVAGRMAWHGGKVDIARARLSPETAPMASLLADLGYQTLEGSGSLAFAARPKQRDMRLGITWQLAGVSSGELQIGLVDADSGIIGIAERFGQIFKPAIASGKVDPALGFAVFALLSQNAALFQPLKLETLRLELEDDGVAERLANQQRAKLGMAENATPAEVFNRLLPEMPNAAAPLPELRAWVLNGVLTPHGTSRLIAEPEPPLAFFAGGMFGLSPNPALQTPASFFTAAQIRLEN